MTMTSATRAAKTEDDAQCTLFELATIVRPTPPEHVPKRRSPKLRVMNQTTLRDPDLDGYHQLADVLRPRSTSACKGKVGPCIHVGCRMHMWSDATTGGRLPRRIREFERLVDEVHPDDWGETCAMRVAQRVHTVATPLGKLSTVNRDGQLVAAPGPVLVGDPRRREWRMQRPESSTPTVVDSAVLGRLLGGLSREQIRKNKNSAVSKCRADEAYLDIALDYDIDASKIDYFGDGEDVADG